MFRITPNYTGVNTRFYYLRKEKQPKSYSIKSSSSTTQEKMSSKNRRFYILSIVPSQSSNASIWKVSTLFMSLFFATIVVYPALALTLAFPVTVLRDFFLEFENALQFRKLSSAHFCCLNSCNHVFPHSKFFAALSSHSFYLSEFYYIYLCLTIVV